MKNLSECMEFVNSYSKSGKPVTDLSRAENLMRIIGNPEKQLDFIHVAGTNGKGSTVEYISNALIYSGYKVGQFTSPFVLHYTDRIRINGSEIEEKSLCEICGTIKDKIDDKPYSQFEITMAVAMLWFRREKCDVVVLEAGIGGLLDCTNVIEKPLLSVITSISLDHTAILGDTVEKIAEQKAGIIKKNSIAILSADNGKSVSKIISKRAEKNCSFFVQPIESNIKRSDKLSDQYFSYKGKNYKLFMAGKCQVYNAVTAIEACFWLRTRYGFKIPEESLERSLETTCVKARMQYIYGTPTVIVDGGHNPGGIRNLESELTGWKKIGKKIYTVMGMVDTKDFEYGVLAISGISDAVFFVDDFAPNTVPAEKMVEIAGNNTSSESCGSLAEAVEKARIAAIENSGIVVVCGSLYLASEYLNYRET